MTRYLLIWLDSDTSIAPRQLSRVRWDIEDTVAAPKDEVEVDIWLESPGGDAHSAYKLALILRHVASRIRVVVPDYAKSAATLLALAGDELYLAPGAELGPLDAQIPEEGSLFGAISALNIARASDAVAQDAVALAMQGAVEMVQTMNLGRAEALNAMVVFSAAFSEPLVRQLDPRLVHQANELLRVTVRYATRLLTKTVGKEKAGEIAKELVEQFPTHGFVIARDEAERLDLPVRPMEEYEFADVVRGYHRASEQGDALIAFDEIGSFLPDEDDEADDQENEDEGDDQRHREDVTSAAASVVKPDGHEAATPSRGR